MRSIFWRILGAFWLALILTGSLTFLLTSFFNQDGWILQRHPGFSATAEQWLELYNKNQLDAANQLLQKNRQQHRVYTQVFDEDGKLVSASSRMRNNQQAPTAGAFSGQHNWRRLTQELNNSANETFLFVYRVQRTELVKWQYGHGQGPFFMVLITVFVLSLVSLLLTLSITKPLSRLRLAVHELGQTAYQQQHLAKLAQRRDELGVLAADFNKMGQRLQDMLHSQRQLLRDVSHELRSPLARLQVGLGLAERASEQQRSELWPKLSLECQRLDALIDEILALARMEQDSAEIEDFDLCDLLEELKQDCLLLDPEQQIHISCTQKMPVSMAKSLLQRALDNLLRNALRFNPPDQEIELAVSIEAGQIKISIRDFGPGVSEDLLPQLTSPFVRAPGQKQQGYGLGLAIAERAIKQLGGKLEFANHQQGGLLASISLALK